MRPRVFTFVIVLILLVSPYLPLPKLNFLYEAHAASVTISLVGNINGWNYTLPSGTNPTITVTYGDSITLDLSSTDTIHRFYVDVNNNGTPECVTPDRCSLQFNTTAPTTYGLMADLNPGTYTYYCSFHQPSMHGTFGVVSAPSSDFSLSANPSSLTILQGGFQTSTISVASQNNFAGRVTLSANSPAGLTVSLSPSIVMPPVNGVATSTLNVTVSPITMLGTYNFPVIGDNGTVTRTTTVTVNVIGPDFTISTSQSSLSLVGGNSGTATITISSINSFSGTVSLTASVSPNGPTGSLNPFTITLSSGSSAASTLTVSTSTSNPPGDYTVTATGTASSPAGPLTHSKQVTVSVSSASSAPSFGPFSPLVLSGILAGLVIISLIVYFARRRSPGT